MAGGATKHLRGAAATAHKEKEAKMGEGGAAAEQHAAASPKRRGRPPGSGKKKGGKARARASRAFLCAPRAALRVGGLLRQ